MAFAPYGSWTTIPAPSRVAHGLHRGAAARAAVADQLRAEQEVQEERRLVGEWYEQDEILYEDDFPPGHFIDPPWTKALKVGGEPLQWSLGG